MSLSIWLYLGVFAGLCAGGIIIFRRIKRIGATEKERDYLRQNKKELEHDLDIAEKQRDVANKPAGSVDDTAGWLSGGNNKKF